VFDSNLDRPYQLTYNVGIQHELLRGTSVSAEWFHSDFKNLIARNNVARAASDYAPVTIYSPIDGSPITYYNISTTKVSAVQNVDSNDPNMTRWYNGIELNLNARLPGGVRVSGGTSIERIITNSCSAADHDPNLLLYCDGSKNNLPWLKSVKMFGTYPLPWYGITFSGAFQGLAGQALGTAPIQYGVFTAGTGFATPNGLGTFWLVTPALSYAANCKGNCTPGARVVPGLTVSSASVGLVAPGTEFTPRVNQLDLGLSKTFTVNSSRITPKLDIFTATNSDQYTAVASTQFGAAAYGQPSVILQGRIVRVGVDVKW
jgi:hypothetical protein